MQEYCAYLIAPDGNVTGRIGFVSENEDVARERAKQLVDGHAVELWEGPIRIATFEPAEMGEAASVPYWKLS